ncbi:biotin transporter BioY [Lachnospiraceae bacterium C1.1]|nr:biotin transporter BioY [Lachnospiraceae bacterium C1.1]
MDSKTTSISNSSSTALRIALIGLMAAMICIFGPLSIPIGVIPVSLTPFAVFLAVYILGKNAGTIAFVVYLLLGLVGLPVFSGFMGGPAKLIGPTGGYLVSFILMAYIAGIFIEKSNNIFIQMLGCFIGLLLSYTIGTIWLSVQASMSLTAALAAAVIPFVPFDIIKIVLAVLLGKEIKKRIKI